MKEELDWEDKCIFKQESIKINFSRVINSKVFVVLALFYINIQLSFLESAYD